MNEVVIVAAARTAVGKFGGSLAKISAADLGAHVIKGLLAQTGVDPQQINEVIMGQVLTAGCGQNPARQAVIKSGLPDMVPAFTVLAMTVPELVTAPTVKLVRAPTLVMLV